jgi:hypothetical protein
MPGRPTRTSLPPDEKDVERLRPAEAPVAPAASAEPMTPRSSDEEADRPRFVDPSEHPKVEPPPPRKPPRRRRSHSSHHHRAATR